MPKIHVAAVGMARKLVGFSQRTIDFPGETVADLLRALETVDGRTLYANLVCEGKLRGDYAILVNGMSLNAEQLETRLEGGDEVVTMAILRHLHGG